MIPDAFWTSWLALWFASGPILLGFVNMAYNRYLSQRHLDAMIEALKNSRYIYTWGPSLLNQGWIGSGLLIAKIAGMIMMPKASIRLGELDPVDLENFPPHLKRLLKIKSVMLIGSAIWFVLVAVLLEFK